MTSPSRAGLTEDPRGRGPRGELARAAARFAAVASIAALLAGCGSIWPWSGPAKARIPDPPGVSAPVPAKLAWTAGVGHGGVGFVPAVAAGSVFAASDDGTVVRLAAESGTEQWRVSLGKRLSAGVGSDGETVVVATRDGSLVALGADGKQRWAVPMGGEAVTVPAVGLGLVVLRSSDNRVSAYDVETGKRRWSFQRQNPPLVLRQTAGIAMSRESAYVGLPGGRLVSLALQNGALRWEGRVSQPRGATEIERIADVAGTPLVSGREVCAVSFQGKLACFDGPTGRPQWSRDVSSASGFDMDARLLAVADDRGQVQAFSRSGSSLWRQDKLAGRTLSAPLSLGPVLLLGDGQGLVHLLSRDDGAVAGRFATDGSAIVSAPVAAGRVGIVQTTSGMVAGIALE